MGNGLGSKVSIKGHLVSSADFYFDGTFEGTIEAVQSVVTLGPEAKMVGDISAKKVVVGGSVVGNILAVELIALEKTSRLEGNVNTLRIAIEDGAQFKGRVDVPKIGAGKGA